MTDELAVIEAPAPEQEPTAVIPEPVDETPVETPKTFTQDDLDAAIGKRLAREQRKWEREHAQRQSEQQTLRMPAVQSADQFETTEAYADALALQKAEELVAKRDAASTNRKFLKVITRRKKKLAVSMMTSNKLHITRNFQSRT